MSLVVGHGAERNGVWNGQNGTLLVACLTTSEISDVLFVGEGHAVRRSVRVMLFGRAWRLTDPIEAVRRKARSIRREA